MSGAMARRGFLKAMGATLIVAGGFETTRDSADRRPGRREPKPPKLKAPPNACDCHMHIYDSRFPVAPTPSSARRRDRRRLSPVSEAHRHDPQRRRHALDLRNRQFLHPRRDGQARRDRARRGGGRHERHRRRAQAAATASAFAASASISSSPARRRSTCSSRLSKRVNDLGWHVQIHMLGDADRRECGPSSAAASPIVFDHMARIPEPAGVDHPAFALMLKMLDRGPDMGEAFRRLHGDEGRASELRRRQQGRAGLREGGAGAAGLGQRLAPPDRESPTPSPTTPSCSTSWPIGRRTKRSAIASWSTIPPRSTGSARSAQRRHHNVRSDVRHAGQRCQAIGMESLVARQIRDRDPEQIVEGARNMVHLKYAGELCDGFLEGLDVAAHVTLQLHSGKDSE